MINQLEVDLLAYEVARLLRVWQIKKCEQLQQFLSTLTQGAVLPNPDPDGLLEWLKTESRMQSPIALFTKVLVSPCCFSQCSLESAYATLKKLAPYENIDKIIQKHPGGYWRAVLEKSDTLIQLPKSFRTNILLRDRVESDDRPSNANVVALVLEKLATALIADLQRLKTEWASEKDNGLGVKFSFFKKKYEEASEAQKNQEHEAGVARIKKTYRYIYSIKSSSNELFPYLYRTETINEVKKKQQVPTHEDLLYVIYNGVDPNSVCHWKSSSSQPYFLSNQLFSYFYPDQKDDSRTQAWLYACTECQVNTVPLFAHLFSPTDRSLALEDTPESQEAIKQKAIKKSLSIQVILKDPKKMASITTHSKVLNNVASKTAQEIEIVFRELQNYYMLALMRVKPAYRNELPLIKQFQCAFKNFFKFGEEIGKERLQSVQLFIGDLCAVFSAEDIDTINKALDDLKENYDSTCQRAQRVNRSALYTIMKKAFDGSISAIISRFTGAERKQFKLEEEKVKLEKETEHLQETTEHLQATLEEVNQDKAEMDKRLKEAEAKLKESEAKRVQDKAEMEVKREKDRTEMDKRLKEAEAKLKEILDRLNPQQSVSTCSASEADLPESREVRFFKR